MAIYLHAYVLLLLCGGGRVVQWICAGSYNSNGKHSDAECYSIYFCFISTYRK
jgi:hypothetical protein